MSKTAIILDDRSDRQKLGVAMLKSILFDHHWRYIIQQSIVNLDPK
jgi:hypothetical protein